MNYKSLIKKLNTANINFDPGKDEFIPVIHELYEKKDHLGMMNVLKSLANNYFRSGDFYFFYESFDCADDKLFEYISFAGNLFGKEKEYEEFYEKSFNCRIVQIDPSEWDPECFLKGFN